MIRILQHHREHFKKVGVRAPLFRRLRVSEKEYAIHAADWQRSGYSGDEVHKRVLAHVLWKRKQRRKLLFQKITKGMWPALAVIGLLLALGAKSHCQFSHINTVTITDNTNTAFVASPYKLVFTGCTVTPAGTTITVACSGGGGGVTSFFGNTGNITALVDPTTIVDASGSFIAFAAGTGTVADLTLQDPSGNVIYLKSLPGFGNPAGISINATGSGGGNCFLNDAVICADSEGNTLDLTGSSAGAIIADAFGDSIATVSGDVDLSDSNGDDCQLQTGTWTCGGASGNPVVAIDNGGQDYPTYFANLPGCSSSTEGSRYAIIDSTVNTWGATITGSGSLHVLAYCDGTNWTVEAK